MRFNSGFKGLIFLMQLLLISGRTKVRWVLGHLYNCNSSFCSILHLLLLILTRNTHVFRSSSSPRFYVIPTVQHISCAMCLAPLTAPRDHPAVVRASPRHPLLHVRMPTFRLLRRRFRYVTLPPRYHPENNAVTDYCRAGGHLGATIQQSSPPSGTPRVT